MPWSDEVPKRTGQDVQEHEVKEYQDRDARRWLFLYMDQ